MYPDRSWASVQNTLILLQLHVCIVYTLDLARGNSPSLGLVVGIPVVVVAMIVIATVMVAISLCLLIKKGKCLSKLANFNVKSG